MDFTGRNSQPSPAAPRPGSSFSADNGGTVSYKTGNSGGSKRLKTDFGLSSGSKWSRILGGVVIIIIAVLFAAVLGFMLTTSDRQEANLVNDKAYQAVFLTNDQVYFGNVSEINGKYMVLNDIYYLQTSGTNNQSQTNNNVSLVKLGCELHKPYDRMVINRDQVQFWENLKSDGQVAKAIDQFKQQNPNGQKCSTTPSGSPQNVQGSTDTGSNTSESTNNNSAANTNKNSSNPATTNP